MIVVINKKKMKMFWDNQLLEVKDRLLLQALLACSKNRKRLYKINKISKFVKSTIKI